MDLLAILAALAALGASAWLHPGPSRPLAWVSALLAALPFYVGATWLVAAAARVLPFGGWKDLVLHALVLVVVVALAVALATVRVERWWLVLVVATAALAWLELPAGALAAGIAMPPLARGGIPDPRGWRRAGGLAALATLAVLAALAAWRIL